MSKKKRLVVLSGAGISQESGIRTFRDMGGLWEEYDVMELASPQAWAQHPELVLRFYNERRKQLLTCKPNKAHHALKELEEYFDVRIITQNVDDLHERAGSTYVVHLHGELRKSRSTADDNLVYPIEGWELKMGDTCEKGSQLRPHVVWFGEAVPFIEQAAEEASQADIFVVVGTSLNVYPAAGLVQYVQPGVPIYLIDPNEVAMSLPENTTYINAKAGDGVPRLLQTLIKQIFND